METQPNDTDTRVLLRYITSCTDQSNPVPAMLVLQQAIDLLEKYPTDKTPILSAWDYIHRAQDALSLATHLSFWRQTPGYQVAATMYILLQLDGLKKPSDEALANDILRVLKTRNNFHFDLDEVNHTIEQMKQCKDAAPPFINPMDICLEIANGKNLAEVDWNVLLKEIVKYKRIFDRTYPYYLLLHGFLHIIPSAMRRVDVLGHLQDAAPSCLEARDAQQFIEEAGWLVHVYTRLHHLLINHQLPKAWNNEPFMNEMALYIVHMEAEEVVAIAQSVFESYDLYNQRIGIVPHILRHKQFLGRLLTTDCVDFCRCLYLTYGFIMLLQSGTEDFRVLPSIDNLDIELRNKCFDVFIKLRVEQLIQQMKSTNRRLYPPTIEEGYAELIKELTQRLKNLEQFGDHYNKVAYDSLLHATKFLTQYAKDRQKERETQSAQSVAKSVAPTQIVAQQVIIESNNAPITSIENSNVTINHGQLIAETCEPVQLAEQVESQPVQQRGPKKQYLFAEENGQENIERATQEEQRIKKYIADHRMGNMRLDSSSKNQLNLLVACFYYKWRDLGWVSEKPQGAAIHRFLTMQCCLLCDVTPKAYARAIADLINGNHKDYNIIDNLRSYFS